MSANKLEFKANKYQLKTNNWFREVEIDFSSVDWMGQGFAHQIFVVFQNEHPEIRLIPINMSEGAARMYAHVTGSAGRLDRESQK